MKLKNIKYYFILLILLFAFLSCSDKSKNDLTNPVEYLNNYGPSWTIYGDYLNISDWDDKNCFYVNNQYSNTNFAYKEGDNTAIKIYWDGSIGKSYFDGTSVNYYGFYLQFKTTKDLTKAGYNKIKFSVKGVLNSNIIEVKGINLSEIDKLNILSSSISATEYTVFSIPITVSLLNVSQVIGFAVKSTNRSDLNSDESIVCIDNIQLIKE